jgi:glycosyltransferase involved in cell wall biosynthesis
MLRYEKDYDPELFKFNKIILSKHDLSPGLRQYIQPEFINELYNMMDIFCYATGGEGFGMPGLECQSAGIPLMMTAYSTAFELTDYGKNGILIPILKDKYGREVLEIGANGIGNAIPDDKAIAELLEISYRNWKSGQFKEYGVNARKFSLKYDWDNIVNLWIKLFEEEA